MLKIESFNMFITLLKTLVQNSYDKSNGLNIPTQLLKQCLIEILKINTMVRSIHCDVIT